MCVERARVNFTTILHAAYTLADPKKRKQDRQLMQLFALWGSASVKDAHKQVDEIDP